MNSMLKSLLLLFVVILVGITPKAQAQQQERTPVQAQKISDNLFQLIGGSGANGGFYIGDNNVMVIDAKMDKQSVEEIFSEIKKVTDKPVKYLINTHADGDHVTGNQYFPEAVTIIAHENCRNEFFIGRNGSPAIWEAPELSAFIPDVTFKENLELNLGSKKVEISYYGVGHTTGDLYLYFADENTAFIGDQYFEGRAQLIHSYKGGSSLEYVKTMNKMLKAIPATQFCSGHSEMTSRESIVAHVNKISQMHEQVRGFITNKKSLEDVKVEFDEAESALVESMYNEITASL